MLLFIYMTNIIKYVIHYKHKELKPTCDLITPNDYKYNPIGYNLENKKYIIFRVNANNDAHISLGESLEHYGKHYEIILGGWDNTRSVIRAYNRQNKPLIAYTGKIFPDNINVGLSYKICNNNINLKGYLKIPIPGQYQFKIISNTIYEIKLDNRVIVKNDKNDNSERRSDEIIFSSNGYYDIEITYYNEDDSTFIDIYWLKPGEDLKKITKKDLFFFITKSQVFWISWYNNIIKVGKYDEIDKNIIMSTDVNKFNYNIKHMMVSTGYGSKGVWKILSDDCKD